MDVHASFIGAPLVFVALVVAVVIVIGLMLLDGVLGAIAGRPGRFVVVVVVVVVG